MPLAGLSDRKNNKKKTDRKGKTQVLNKVRWQPPDTVTARTMGMPGLGTADLPVRPKEAHCQGCNPGGAETAGAAVALGRCLKGRRVLTAPS